MIVSLSILVLYCLILRMFLFGLLVDVIKIRLFLFIIFFFSVVFGSVFDLLGVFMGKKRLKIVINSNSVFIKVSLK